MEKIKRQIRIPSRWVRLPTGRWYAFSWLWQCHRRPDAELSCRTRWARALVWLARTPAIYANYAKNQTKNQLIPEILKLSRIKWAWTISSTVAHMKNGKSINKFMNNRNRFNESNSTDNWHKIIWKKSRQNHNKNCYKTVNFEKMNEKHSGCNNSYTEIFFQWTTTKKAQFSRQNVLTWMGRLPPLGFSWLGDCGLEMILDMVLAVLLRDESVLESGSCYKTTNEKKRQATDGQDISSCVRRLKASPKKTTKFQKTGKLLCNRLIFYRCFLHSPCRESYRGDLSSGHSILFNLVKVIVWIYPLDVRNGNGARLAQTVHSCPPLLLIFAQNR